MKLRFLGEIVPSQTRSGCSSCGSSSLTTSGFIRKPSKRIILNDMTQLEVRVGQIIEVSYENGQSLLELTTQTSNGLYSMFEVV